MAVPAQQALDIAVNAQSRIQNGGIVEKDMLLQICAAIQLLAQASLGATPSSVSIGDGFIAADVATTTPDITPNS